MIDWLQTAVADAAVMMGLLTLLFAPLERAFPAKPRPRERTATVPLDLCFFIGQQLGFNLLVLLWFYALRGALAPLTPDAVHHAFRVQPLWLQIVEVVMLGDLVAYWGHRAQHRFDVLWRFHAVHHSPEHLDWLSAHREHPLDALYKQTCMNLPIAMLGFDLAPAAGLVVFRGAWAVFVHSNTRIPLGPLVWLVGAPQLHHWHHARTRQAKNFGNLAPWADLLFGTHQLPDREPDELGLEQPLPPSYPAMLLQPLGLWRSSGRDGLWVAERRASY